MYVGLYGLAITKYDATDKAHNIAHIRAKKKSENTIQCDQNALPFLPFTLPVGCLSFTSLHTFCRHCLRQKLIYNLKFELELALCWYNRIQTLKPAELF